MKENNEIFRINKPLSIYLFLLLLISYSCQQRQSENSVAEDKKSTVINHDSLLKELFHYNEHYFKIHSIEKLVALQGKPIHIQKKEWGYDHDSMFVVSYPFLTFNFLENQDSTLELERICFFDTKVTLAGGISIGKSTHQDIIQKFGLLKEDGIDAQKQETVLGFIII